MDGTLSLSANVLLLLMKCCRAVVLPCCDSPLKPFIRGWRDVPLMECRPECTGCTPANHHTDRIQQRLLALHRYSRLLLAPHQNANNGSFQVVDAIQPSAVLWFITGKCNYFHLMWICYYNKYITNGNSAAFYLQPDGK